MFFQKSRVNARPKPEGIWREDLAMFGVLMLLGVAAEAIFFAFVMQVSDLSAPGPLFVASGICIIFNVFAYHLLKSLGAKIVKEVDPFRIFAKIGLGEGMVATVVIGLYFFLGPEPFSVWGVTSRLVGTIVFGFLTGGVILLTSSLISNFLEWFCGIVKEEMY